MKQVEWDWRGPCNGPRDCTGTERGCAVCDPRIEGVEEEVKLYHVHGSDGWKSAAMTWEQAHKAKKALDQCYGPEHTIRINAQSWWEESVQGRISAHDVLKAGGWF